MSEAGYTLVETMAAMAVISLAMGGLVLGVEVLAPSQRATSQAVAKLDALRHTQQRLEGLLARGAPFASSDPAALTGDGQSVRFACGAANPCRAELTAMGRDQQLQLYDGDHAEAISTVSAPKAARFTYRGIWTADAKWPPSDPAVQPLRAVALVAGSDATDPALIDARVWREQTATCAFDPVSGTCP